MSDKIELIPECKVAVLMGGQNAEHDVSMHSGQGVLEALLSKGVDAHAVIVDQDIEAKLQQGAFDHAFIVLHGRGGEDGVMQALLERLDIPFTGSGVAASALAMDKYQSYEVINKACLTTPKYKLLHSDNDLQDLVDLLSLPMAVKPVHEGSSNGVTKVKTVAELAPAYQHALTFNDDVMAEKWIEGGEYTVPIVGEQVLPSVKISTPNHEFYDYESKYIDHSTVYDCPSDLDEAAEAQIQKLAMQAFKAIGCRHWGRADFMRDAEGNFYFIEMNTIPGMTETSLLPKSAKVAGMDYAEVVLKILNLSLEDA